MYESKVKVDIPLDSYIAFVYHEQFNKYVDVIS